MKLLGCPVFEVANASEYATEPFVDASVVRSWRTAPDRRAIVRQQAATFLKDLRAKGKGWIHQQHQKWLDNHESAEQERLAVLTSEYDQKLRSEMDAMIQWIFEAEEIENRVYARILAKAVNWLEAALETVSAQVDWGNLLETQLKAYLAQSPVATRMIVWASPSALPRLKEHLTAYEGLECLAKDGMDDKQMRLETEFFNLTLDLTKSLEDIRRAIAEQWPMPLSQT